MFSKPVRFGLLIVGLVVSAALGYRAVDDESSLGRAYRDAASHGRAGVQAHAALLELRAALHAYVAPGQDVTFWSRRAEQAMDAARDQLLALDEALPAQSRSASGALDALDQLAAAERRARDYARRGEALLAGDVVFVEARDPFQTALDLVQQTRNELSAAYDARVSALRREQAIIAAAGALMWAIIAGFFFIPMKPEPEKKPEQWRQELATAIKKPIPKDPAQPPTPAPASPAPLPPTAPMTPGALMWAIIAGFFFIPMKPEPEKKPEQWRQELATAIKKPIPKDPAQPPTPAPASPAPLPPTAPMTPGVPVQAIRDVGEICADLSTLTDVGALSGALERAAAVIDASGVIVWLAANDGNSLAPVASHGFDPKLVSRIGRIARDSANLTAAAFRENVARVSPATGEAPAALAVALCGPSGTVGVLSVELKPNVAPDEGRVALATIFAAQLATLAAPLPSPVSMAPKAQSSAAV